MFLFMARKVFFAKIGAAAAFMVAGEGHFENLQGEQHVDPSHWEASFFVDLIDLRKRQSAGKTE